MLRDAKKSCELFPTRVIRTVETQRSFSSDLPFRAGSRLLSDEFQVSSYTEFQVSSYTEGTSQAETETSTPLAKISSPWVDLVVLIVFLIRSNC